MSQNSNSKIEINYDNLIIFSDSIPEDYNKYKFPIINVCQSNEFKFSKDKTYLFLSKTFLNDTVSVYFYNYKEEKEIFKNVISTDSITNIAASFVYEYTYFQTPIKLIINNTEYRFSIKYNLNFVLIYYNRQEKSIKITNTNKIPDFLCDSLK